MYGTGISFYKKNCEKILKHNFIFLAHVLLATKTGASNRRQCHSYVSLALPILSHFEFHADTTWYVVNCDWVLFFNCLITALSCCSQHRLPAFLSHFSNFHLLDFSYVAMYYSTFNVYNWTLQYKFICFNFCM